MCIEGGNYCPVFLLLTCGCVVGIIDILLLHYSTCRISTKSIVHSAFHREFPIFNSIITFIFTSFSFILVGLQHFAFPVSVIHQLFTFLLCSGLVLPSSAFFPLYFFVLVILRHITYLGHNLIVELDIPFRVCSLALHILQFCFSLYLSFTLLCYLLSVFSHFAVLIP